MIMSARLLAGMVEVEDITGTSTDVVAEDEEEHQDAGKSEGEATSANADKTEETLGESSPS